MKYFEIEFDNKPCNQKNTDDNTAKSCSICILGERKPSIQEATEFCKTDMKNMGYKYVVNVLEIPEEEAKTFFDIKKEEDFPIFR